MKYPQLLVITGVDDTADPGDWVLKEPNQKYADEVVSNADFTRDHKEVSDAVEMINKCDVCSGPTNLLWHVNGARVCFSCYKAEVRE